MTRLICSYTLKNPLLFATANISMVISSLGSIALPFVCGLIIDDIKTEQNLLKHSLYLLAVTIVLAVSSSIRGYCFNVLG